MEVKDWHAVMFANQRAIDALKIQRRRARGKRRIAIDVAIAAFERAFKCAAGQAGLLLAKSL
jgi:hypothetical protein